MASSRLRSTRLSLPHGPETGPGAVRTPRLYPVPKAAPSKNRRRSVPFSRFPHVLLRHSVRAPGCPADGSQNWQGARFRPWPAEALRNPSKTRWKRAPKACFRKKCTVLSFLKFPLPGSNSRMCLHLYTHRRMAKTYKVDYAKPLFSLCNILQCKKL